ncbi:MAG: DUF59 domain-containing protein [Burkholderiales bacterium]|jgi:metal-sulfur cluster biosynthetic enzyme|nr:DUF59 domain-containing protein [Burkholderiales bacterium]
MHSRLQAPEMILSGPVDALLRALDELRHVCDPEVGENIVDLGLIESLRLADGEAELRLVGTGAACPLSDLTAEEAFRAIQRVLPDTDIFVTHDPSVEWSPQRVHSDMRRRLGWVVATP